LEIQAKNSSRKFVAMCDISLHKAAVLQITFSQIMGEFKAVHDVAFARQ
jgi:hypothetical protein